MFSRLFSRFDQRARLPEGLRVYAIGDIHGCADLLSGVFDLIDDDLARSRPQRAIQVFLGDYVDRGPGVSRTLDLLIARGQTHEAVFLRGNHEAILSDFLRDHRVLTDWLRLGGATTLMSYGVPATAGDVVGDADAEAARAALSRAMPRSHLAFLGNLAPSLTCGDFFFAHAGVRPGIPLDRQSEQDLMWIREPFLSSREDFGKVVVHGHTPVRDADIREHRVNIDVGGYATGRLAVLAIEDHRLEVYYHTRPR